DLRCGRGVLWGNRALHGTEAAKAESAVNGECSTSSTRRNRAVNGHSAGCGNTTVTRHGSRLPHVNTPCGKGCDVRDRQQASSAFTVYGAAHFKLARHQPLRFRSILVLTIHGYRAV